VKQQKLVAAMLTGDHEVDSVVLMSPSADDWGKRAVALGLFGLCAAAVWWLVSLGG
jgi:hypothetical protein